ncbi:outer membrane beta-barrel protein [Chitinophaga horti]|uniref:Outer membrane beta-barrel protein n=1 Tax=Chitinophaga horti TaxID=2920382 RepID=A0ABY6IXG3_9BACT|nr:outer membrane beta-barrel protein [Chitinophaga horti]UYQ91990.1 outer membrane beta-barrel protein [Chitinophaga horti]
MMRFLWALSMGIIVCSTLSGQSVNGRVTDAVSGQQLGFVTVNVLQDSLLKAGTVTDTAGHFIFKSLPPGKYTLVFSSLGYQSLRHIFFMTNADIDLGELRLPPDAALLSGVTVAGEKPPFQRAGDRLIVQVTGNTFFATATNAIDILRKLPGLEVAGDGTMRLPGGAAPAVFINGRVAQMSPEELLNYLNALPPQQIASIEFIANPSGRYDGEYKGIIDIHLKRDEADGWQGNAGVTLQRNRYTVSDQNVSLRFRRQAFTFATSVYYTTGSRFRTYNALQRLANQDVMATRTRIPTGNNNLSVQLGAAYRPAKGQQLEVLLRSSGIRQYTPSYNTLHTTDPKQESLKWSNYTHNLAWPRQQSYTGELWYAGQWQQTRLEATASWLRVNSRQREDIQTFDAANDALLDYWKTRLQNNLDLRLLQLDASRKTETGAWRAGVKFAFNTTRNNLRYDTLHQNGPFVPDSARSSAFRYHEYIMAAYLLYEHAKGPWQYSLNLRLEFTDSRAYDVRRRYLSWLPAASVTYKFGEAHQLNANFSRRLTRPTFAFLNPFRFYFSPQNYWVGNPYLQPSITSTFSLAYTRRALTVTAVMGREDDAMIRYPEYDSATNMLAYLGRNVPYHEFASLEVSWSHKASNWWRMQYVVRGNYRKEQMPYHGVTYAVPVKDVVISGSQVFTLPANITLDLTGYFRSINGNSLYVIHAAGYLDVGLQRNWLKGKLSSKLNFYDLFDTQVQSLVFREKQIIDNRLRHWFGYRRAALTLQYSFGKNLQQGRQRGRNEEENRAGVN